MGFENIFSFGKKKTVDQKVADHGGITEDQLKIEQQKDKVMQQIEKDQKLKRVYDFWFGKTDEAGKNMQEKLVEFLMKNPKVEVGYNKTTKEFVNAKMAGSSSSVS